MTEFGLILCERCGRIQDEEETETYQENVDCGYFIPMSRTTCCKSSYADVDRQTIVDFLGELRDLQRPATKGYVLPCMVLSQIQRDNLDCIIPVLEKALDL